MIIGFTGTQSGMTDWQKEQLAFLLTELKCTEFCHGDCIGADAQANQIALDSGVKIFSIFPPLEGKKRAWVFNPSHNLAVPNWQFMRVLTNKDYDIQVRWAEKKQYLERNRDIVMHCQHMIAAPKEHTHTLRSGTWATIRYAWKIKKEIIIIPPIRREEGDGNN